MLRKLVILWLSLSLVVSVLGGIAKIARHFEAKSDTSHELANQIATLDLELARIEAKVGKRPAIRADLVEAQEDFKRLVERNSQELRWNWWGEGIQPILLFAFLWLLIKNKKLLTEQVGAGDAEEAV